MVYLFLSGYKKQIVFNLETVSVTWHPDQDWPFQDRLKRAARTDTEERKSGAPYHEKPTSKQLEKHITACKRQKYHEYFKN